MNTRSAEPLVLDTNATLDWLLFDDPGMRPLAAAIEAGAVRWLACERMRVELAHMLRHPSLAHWPAEPAAALARFDRWVDLQPNPVTPVRVACTDPDDQVFVDLALAHRARWLVSHDRAVLKLARRLRVHGVVVIKPVQWAALQPAG